VSGAWRLFVGGVADGRRIKVEDGQAQVVVPVVGSLVEASTGDRAIELHTYLPHRFAAGQMEAIIFARDCYSGSDVLHMLIGRYPEPGDPDKFAQP